LITEPEFETQDIEAVFAVIRHAPPNSYLHKRAMILMEHLLQRLSYKWSMVGIDELTGFHELSVSGHLYKEDKETK